MKVHELIAVLQALPLNATVLVDRGYDEIQESLIYDTPKPSQEWDDDAENYKVVI